MRLSLSAALCSLLLLATAPVLAAEPYLVKDINPTPENASSNPRELTVLDNGVTLFVADSTLYNPELWRTDGTAPGTYQLTEPVCEGIICKQKQFQRVAQAGNRFFFLTWGLDSGERSLWISDGTVPGTFRLVGPLLVSLDDHPVWVKSRGLLFFDARTGPEEPHRLWRSDGTPAGTYPLIDLSDGISSHELTEFKGKLYFAYGSGLWASDGTSAGTQLLKEFERVSANSPVRPYLMRSIGSALVFFGPGVSPLGDLWRSDGTARGTVRFASVGPGEPGSPTYWTGVAVLNGRYYVGMAVDERGEELWVSDGTRPGTRQLTDFALPEALSPYPGALGFELPTRAAGSRVVFVARDAEHGIEPWVTDGTRGGTRLLRDLCPGSCSSYPFVIDSAGLGSRLIVVAEAPARGSELWTTDGTPGGTRLIRDICRGPCWSRPSSLLELGGKLVFQATDRLHGTEIWRSDGTSQGTVRVTNFPLERPNFGNGVRIPGAVLFPALNPPEGAELWRTDGTAQGTFLLRDIADQDQGGSHPSGLFAVSGRIFFYAEDGIQDDSGGPELWASDGTGSGTSLIHEFTAATSLGEKKAAAGDTLFLLRSVGVELELWRTGETGDDLLQIALPGLQWTNPLRIEAVGKRVFFLAQGTQGNDLWTSDGTVAGTRKLNLPGPVSDLASFQEHLLFGVGPELWASDGTPAGTAPLITYPADLQWLSGPQFLGQHGGRLWFTGSEIASNGTTVLWSTNGTTQGTTVHSDFPVGNSSAPISHLVSAGSRMFLLANGGLWVSDGTAAGTRRIAPAPLDFERHAVLAGRLFYWFGSLWSSDGTEAGTGPVLDADGDEIDLYLQRDLAVFGRHLYFNRNEEVWRTDGSPAGTARIGSRFPRELTPAEGRLFFSSWDPATGHELWAIVP